MHPRQLEQRILKAVGNAIRDFAMIEEGDRILVALSGGKDSYGLLWALRKVQAAAPIDFSLFAYHLDQGQPGHNPTPLKEHLERLGVEHEIEYQDTYSRVLELTEPGKTYCSACSHFRRAILYNAATRHGCNKVALGHHRDDLIETLLLNLFFSGQLKSMPPRLLSDAGTHQVIRPLCYVPEEHMRELSEQQGFAILPCNLCGSQATQRKFVKDLVDKLTEHTPHLKGNILRAMANVVPSHLMDPALNPLYPGSGTGGADDNDGLTPQAAAGLVQLGLRQ